MDLPQHLAEDADLGAVQIPDRLENGALLLHYLVMPRFGFPDVVDAVTVRLVAALVLLIALLALLTGRWWLYAVLATDFVLRSAFGPSMSPLAQVATRWVRPHLDALPRRTAGAPKRFAATLGALLTTGAAMLGMAASASGSEGLRQAAFALGSIMVVFPALEALAGVCVGCVFYTHLMRVGLTRPEACLDCAS
ncbi:MAG: DUF4395 domain-containing protein [Dermatophilaceae bacterium]